MKKKWIIWLFLLPAVLFTESCETSGYRIPYVRVDLHINILGELGNPANTSHRLIDGGASGLIVYREDYDLFHVYDRTCTLYPAHTEAVEEDINFEGVFTCPECESQFLLLTGGDPISGEAVFGLHEYGSRVEGDLLHVYNY